MKFMLKLPVTIIMLPFMAIGFAAGMVYQGVYAGWWLVEPLIDWLGEKQ